MEDPRYRRYLFDGGARSGKTDLSLVWLASQAQRFPGARILVARRALDHARTTLWNLSLKKLLPPGCGVRYQEQTLEARFPNGSVIRVGGLDDAERVDKILGDEYLHIFINEATQISWDTLTKVLTRLSQRIPGAQRKLILDCNPKGPRHWLHQAGVQHVVPSQTGEAVPLPDADAWARLSWTPYDNPHLPEDTIRTLEALPGVMRRRMLLGEWCSSEGAVYDSYDPDLHEFATLPAGSEAWPRIRAIDFGFTNPFVCLWGAVDGDGRLWIYRELRKPVALPDVVVVRWREAIDQLMPAFFRAGFLYAEKIRRTGEADFTRFDED
ncbi:MAG: phage terminase large subunit [Victivallales bacterium]|nr:phage terminase large subunit [Victivallales bacterium]